MSLLAEIPLRAGDKIKIIDSTGKVLKIGKLATNPSGSKLPYSDVGEGVRSFYFDDEVFAMDNQEYSIEVEGLNKGFRVRPISSFKVVEECIKQLAALKSGDAYESFRQSIINDFLKNGYSEVRASQVIDELMSSFSKK